MVMDTAVETPTVVETLAEDPAPSVKLLSPYKLGNFSLLHRVVLAPLTRNRAIGNIPQPAAVTYYEQRATPGGLLITECTGINPTANGYAANPGIYTEEQIEAWKPVVKAVHDKGGVFFCQLWHAGRISHSVYQPNGAAPVSSVAKRHPGKIHFPNGDLVPCSTPRALETEEIPLIVEDYRIAARNAIAAGFDGVEVHGGYGYLLDQFLKDRCNTRKDRYGGSLENRCRFFMEVMKAVVDEIGADRTGVRLYDHHPGVDSTDPVSIGLCLAQQMSNLDILYAHYVEPWATAGPIPPATRKSLNLFRKTFKNTFIVAGGYDRENGIQAVDSGYADLVAYGRNFLANPDLVKRFEVNAPLNPYDVSTFYTQDQVKGYTDYPFLDGK